MVNGREDFDLPYATAQVPMFNMLGPTGTRGTPSSKGANSPAPQAVFKEILDLLDHALGSVEP